MSRTGPRRYVDESLAVRAAWMHYAGGITQVEVARRLGVSSATASRLIASAHDNGAVRVSVVGVVAECLELETRVAERFGLSACEVAPDVDEPGLPLKTLGQAGAARMQRLIEDASREEAGAGEAAIGIGHGRTLAATIDALPVIEAQGVRFVSLLGGVTRNYAANPHDVMFSLARKARATSYTLPVPFFANTAEDRTVLLGQRGVRDVFAMAQAADPMVVGIGTAKADAQLVASGMIEADEIDAVQRKGGVGELLGHFFDADGGIVETPLSGRTISPALDRLKGRWVIAIAGGPDKVAAIAAVLRSGFVRDLIVDERTAKALVET